MKKIYITVIFSCITSSLKRSVLSAAQEWRIRMLRSGSVLENSGETMTSLFVLRKAEENSLPSGEFSETNCRKNSDLSRLFLNVLVI